MNALERELAPLLRVRGSLGAVVLRGGRRHASQLAAAIGPGRLTRAAAEFVALGALAEKAGFPDVDFVARFARVTLLCYRLATDAQLLVLCLADVPSAPLDLKARVAADQLTELLADEASADTAGVPSDLAERRRLVWGRHHTWLREACDAFCQATGPLGRVLFDHHVDEWMEAGPILADRLPELAAALAAELDDPCGRRFAAALDTMRLPT